MPNLVSDTAASILALLNNVNDLIVKSSDRKNAVEVMKAIKIYAKNKSFQIPYDKIDIFIDTILDSKPITLTTLINEISSAVIAYDAHRPK